MFKLIFSLLQKSYNFIFHKDKNQIGTENQQISETYFGELSFQLTHDEHIDISYFLPVISNKTPEEIAKIAEKYARFLMAINEGYLRDDIIQLFDNQAKNSENPDDHLFWDNVMVYWGILHVEAIKNRKQRERKDQPLIRPISVFNVQN